MKLIFEKSKSGRTAVDLPACDVPEKSIDELIPANLRRTDAPNWPEIGELDLVRHYVELSRRNMGIDTNFYPLGSCTMKYNPKRNEKVAAMPGFAGVHPYTPESAVQGWLEVMVALQEDLAAISGMDAISLQPAAGAQGELAGLMVIKAYLDDTGQGERNEVLIPDSAHGTNPASSAICGFKTITVKSGEDGLTDIEDLKKKAGPNTAAIMITNPNTLGLFEERIDEITRIIHDAGGQVYMDGANMNAIMSQALPGEFGVDVQHFNLHKTFSTPHGGGGPGSGAIGVKAHLAPFLPTPVPMRSGDGFKFDWDRPKSIGRVKAFYGNSGMFTRAYTYIRANGYEGLKRVSQYAVLNARYLLTKLEKAYQHPHDKPAMHEFVLSANRQKKRGARALDIAKRLIDLGFHPPTIYFPLIVPEALMIEPTETESKETLDRFAKAMIKIAIEARDTPEKLTSAPHNMPVSRLDEVKAAREPVLRWKPKKKEPATAGA